MRNQSNIHLELIEKLRNKFIEQSIDIEIPPPAFAKMKGKVLEYDDINLNIRILFPIDRENSNPFGNMQGGMIAAAIDNTFGPLSMLAAPLNYTRKLEVKYKKPVTKETEYIIVDAHVQDIKAPQIILVANVLDDNEIIVVKAKAIHWIL